MADSVVQPPQIRLRLERARQDAELLRLLPVVQRGIGRIRKAWKVPRFDDTEPGWERYRKWKANLAEDRTLELERALHLLAIDLLGKLDMTPSGLYVRHNLLPGLLFGCIRRDQTAGFAFHGPRGEGGFADVWVFQPAGLPRGAILLAEDTTEAEVRAHWRQWRSFCDRLGVKAPQRRTRNQWAFHRRVLRLLPKAYRQANEDDEMRLYGTLVTLVWPEGFLPPEEEEGKIASLRGMVSDLLGELSGLLGRRVEVKDLVG